MKKKMILKRIRYFQMIFSFLAMLIAGTVFAVQAEETSDLSQLLTEKYWVNDFQALMVYEFTEDGEVYKYYYEWMPGEEPEDSFLQDGSYYEDGKVNVDQLSLKSYVGTYTVENDQLTIHGSGEEEWTSVLEYRAEVPEEQSGYVDRYQGEHFLYEYGWVNEHPDWPEQSPMYLYGVGTRSVSESETSVSWEGVYYHNDGYQGEYYFLQQVNGNSITGAEIAMGITGEAYDCYRLNWTIDDTESSKAFSPWQADRYTHYQSLEDRILEDESEYRAGDNQKEYFYICSIEEAAAVITHPNLGEALSLLNLSVPADTSNASNHSPFYGIWCIGSHDKADCDRIVADLNAKGFSANVYETTDWSNLNPVHWYVVSAGEYGSEAEAAASLANVQAVGYADAYVKYTGDYQK